MRWGFLIVFFMGFPNVKGVFILKGFLCFVGAALFIVSGMFVYSYLYHVPNFEMQVSHEQSQRVKKNEGLVYYSSHADRVCGGGVAVSSSDAGVSFPDVYNYSCANDALGSCPSMHIDYENDTTVFVSEIYVARSDYHFDYIKQCVHKVIALGDLSSSYRSTESEYEDSYDGVMCLFCFSVFK